jgi:hypothetical protein
MLALLLDAVALRDREDRVVRPGQTRGQKSTEGGRPLPGGVWPIRSHVGSLAHNAARFRHFSRRFQGSFMLHVQIRLTSHQMRGDMRSPSAAGLIIGFLTVCTQPSRTHTNPEPVTTRSSDASSVVTGLELARPTPSGTLMAALQQIRPEFLTARGGRLMVSVDGLVFADTSILHTIAATDVCAVRLQRGTSGAGRSVILPNGRVSSGGDLIDVSLRHDTTCPPR